MTIETQLTERLAAVVDDLLQRNTTTRGQRVTRMELRRDRLVVMFGPVIEGVAVNVDKTVDIFDLLKTPRS